MLNFIILLLTIVIWLLVFKEYDPKVPQKFQKYLGAVHGYILGYNYILNMYFSVFGFDFTYWYYITPFSIIPLMSGISWGYKKYLDRKRGEESYHIFNGGFVALVFSIIYRICLGHEFDYLFFPYGK